MAEASPDFLAQFEHEHDISYVEKRPPHRDGLRRFGYGYRKVAALLRQAGWSVSDGRVGGIWKREGLKVASTQVGLSHRHSRDTILSTAEGDASR